MLFFCEPTPLVFFCFRLFLSLPFICHFMYSILSYPNGVSRFPLILNFSENLSPRWRIMQACQDQIRQTKNGSMVWRQMDKIKTLPSDQIAEVVSFIDFIRQHKRRVASDLSKKRTFNLPVDHEAVFVKNLSYRREDMYNDDGRWDHTHNESRTVDTLGR